MNTVVCRGIDPEGKDENFNIRLTGRRLHLLRGHEDHGGVIVPKMTLGDQAWNTDSTGWHEILGVSADCKYYTQENVGEWVWLPENNGPGNAFRVGPGEMIINEEWFDKPGGPALMSVRR